MTKETIVRLIREGYTVTLSKELFHNAKIEVSKNVEELQYRCQQMIPIDRIHMEDVRLHEVLIFCKESVDGQIKNYTK